MRIYNRIFKDPDSDPEQDLYGMISSHVDHAGLLLMMYPRPVFVAAAVLDFFPIEGTHKTVREVTEFYSKFHHADRVGIAEGYHAHEYSVENQEAAMDFLDHFNGLPARRGLAPVKELDEKMLLCTRTGQVMLDFEDARSLMDVIREYYTQHKSVPAKTLKQLYYSELYPRINSWSVAEFRGEIPGREQSAGRLAEVRSSKESRSRSMCFTTASTSNCRFCIFTSRMAASARCCCGWGKRQGHRARLAQFGEIRDGGL